MISFFSCFHWDWILKPPLPLKYISCSSSELATIGASFEKSGPLIIFNKSFKSDFGFSRTFIVASITSLILCDGMSVAIPTAIPDVPFKSIIGSFDGKITGSSNEPSKLGCQSTVPDLSSEINKLAKFVNFDSVYLIAAKDLGSSWDPQLPCPSTKGYLKEKFCAIRTIASYAALSPWGWNLPITSPTVLADFLYFDDASNPNSDIAYKILLCTGFNPSPTFGRALSKITYIA